MVGEFHLLINQQGPIENHNENINLPGDAGQTCLSGWAGEKAWGLEQATQLELPTSDLQTRGGGERRMGGGVGGWVSIFGVKRHRLKGKERVYQVTGVQY